ncbi:hypothetical protein ACOSP7_021284 [Xanthoceras sorbifolium]
MNFIFEVHLRRTTNPLGSRSNPEGSKNDEPSGFEIEPRGFEDRTPLGSISNPEGFEDRTLLGSCLRTQKGSCLRTLLGSRSNPEGSFFEPSGFHEPRRVRIFEPFWVRDRTQRVPFWVRGTQRVRDRTQKGSISNPLGLKIEPSGFDLEPRRVRRYEPFWVRGTQRVRRTNPLGSWNPEGSKIEPSGFDLEPRRVRRHEPFWVRRHEPRRVRSSNPCGFDLEPRGFVVLRTLLGSRSNPEGFDLRNLLGSISNPEGSSFFEDELRR